MNEWMNELVALEVNDKFRSEVHIFQNRQEIQSVPTFPRLCEMKSID